MSTNTFVETFMIAASEVHRELPAEAFSWVGSAGNPPAILAVKPSPGGFPIELECQTYGIYQSSLGWHGAPWDVTVSSSDDISRQVKDFLRSVLGPSSSLEIHRADGKPYKYILNYEVDGHRVAEKSTTWVYHWFGPKTVEILRNHWIPAR